MNLNTGESIGEYKIIRKLGEGTFGQVYLAEWQTRRGLQQGALKLLKKQKNKTVEQEFAEILDEVATWGRVSQHENVVTFLGAKRYQGQFLMLSEYIEGGALDDWLKDNGGKAPSLEIAVKLFLGILAGLKHLHDNDIIHRDVKPANVMLKGETPLLVDFGLARGLDLVQSSILAGSMIYMPPELLDALLNHMPGQVVERNEQHDLWPAAVTFQEMITGRRPFETPGQISQAAPHPLPASFPQAWQVLMKRAFAKDPAQRYQSAEEMSEAVNEAFYGCMADTMPPQRVWPPSFVNEYGIEFVRLEAGGFMMGSEDCPDERPQHPVKLPYQFYLGKFQVTQKQWEQVIGENPSRFRDCASCPVEQVSWNDVKTFIARLNKTDHSYHYRLPSEAEWEFAARAGTSTAFAYGDALSSKQANFDGNYPYGGAAQGEYKEKTTPVGSYEPNPWGLYDMHGNVWEWCEDIYQDTYRDLPGDGTANLMRGDTSFRVLRGGSRLSNGDRCRSATRYWSSPDIRSSYFGFRLVAVPLM